jgi:Tfp pilus assembly PilM family ATPase
MSAMKSNTSSFCGLDLQRDYFSIVQYSAEERAVTLLSIISPFAGDVGGDGWKTWKNELKKNRGRLLSYNPSVVCSMPSEYAVIKLIPVDADEENTDETLRWELGQQIVGSLDDYVFDFEEVTSVFGDPTRKFLAVAYRNELVNRMAGMVRSVKMDPQIVDIDIFGLVNVFEANYRDKRNVPSLLVHSERTMTKFVLTHRGAFRGYHCFEHATGVYDAPAFAGLLSTEIDRFLAATGTAAASTGIYIAGSYFQQSTAREAFFEKVTGADILNPFREIKCRALIEEDQFKEYSTQLAVAVGLALRGSEGS